MSAKHQGDQCSCIVVCQLDDSTQKLYHNGHPLLPHFLLHRLGGQESVCLAGLHLQPPLPSPPSPPPPLSLFFVFSCTGMVVRTKCALLVFTSRKLPLLLLLRALLRHLKKALQASHQNMSPKQTGLRMSGPCCRLTRLLAGAT